MILKCRVCGSGVAEESEFIKAIKKEYDYSNSEIEEGTIKAYHLDCAMAEEKTDILSEADAARPFYFEFLPRRA